jgi:NodT family efflux transporter outer membrane factor (OMF) lipoprotein
LFNQSLGVPRQCGVASVLALLPACFTIGPDHDTLPVEVNTAWSTELAATQPAAQPAPDWWRGFGDPVLDGLIAEALAQNLSLEIAGLRVLEARVRGRVSYQLLAPLPLLGGSVAHLNLSQNVKPDVEVDVAEKPGPKTIHLPGGPLNPGGKTITIDPDITVPEVKVSDSIDVYDVGLDAIWELDLWGKKRRGICEATAELEAAVATYADASVSIAGEVAATYVRMRTLEDRLRVLDKDLASLRQAFDSARKRGEGGAATDLDELQLAALIAESEAGRPPLVAAERAARSALCILLGRPPGALDERLAASAPIPGAPAAIGRGIPADLLRRRADVRYAERIAAANCERIGMRKSELLPQLSLFGSIGWASSHSSDLFDGESGRGAYGGGVKWNILLYTVIMDAVRMADAEYQAAIFGYQETVLDAAREVEDASDALVAANARLEKLEVARTAQESAASMALDRYARGDVDLARLLDALRSLVRIHGDASQERGTTALAAIALYKALGGGWDHVDPENLLDDATWKALESRTDWDWYKPEAPEQEGGAK